MHFVIHVSINEEVLINLLQKQTPRYENIFCYISGKNSETKSYRKQIWVAKSCAQVNSLLRVLWYLTPLPTIFQFISWWSVLLKEKTTDLPQVTDKLYHIIPERNSNVSGDRHWFHR